MNFGKLSSFRPIYVQFLSNFNSILVRLLIIVINGEPNLVHFCLFQADSLKKSLKGSGNGCSLDSKMQQVKELEDEVSFSHFIFHVRRHLYLIIPFLQMANVDREMAALGEERAEKSKRLNLKRMQHVSTLQQLSKFFLENEAVFLHIIADAILRSSKFF